MGITGQNDGIPKKIFDINWMIAREQGQIA